MSKAKSIGICVGSSTVKAVMIDEDYKLIKTFTKNHECNPKKVLTELSSEPEFKDYDYITVTGGQFKELLNVPSITEPEAIEYALAQYCEGNYNALISLGSENFILYVLDEGNNIIKVNTGNKCASGTGEFFLQQIGRMDIGIDDAISQAHESEPYRVSGRCSVFCKSDCTHALNKGVAKGRISAGLGDMIADKIIELLHAVPKERIIVVGGVTKNSYVVKKLKEKIKELVIPQHANVFEAMGAAAYALKNKKRIDGEIKVKSESNSFSKLPPLSEASRLVEFKEQINSAAKEGDVCILGLDVGSTTTKAVLMRKSDNRMTASIYLRTNGDPIAASRKCYAEIERQLAGKKVKIVGLGVTGSGRHIAGLHALTDGIINEIIAHATGAAFFDKDVDTIIEIGGQDAKYTFLVNGVPCDYAMNEACSAGTGSFLEEATKESLNINYLDIQDIALKAKNPPNFNDQCAAFISSDVKNASHEDISKEDIVAGLVYSICLNYNNRVKGNRAVGERIFMQGGVCYNKAVPMAMATILGKKIIVPPEPGLIGAFGVALEVKNRISMGLINEKEFVLSELANREVGYGKSFVCPGKPENCDRGCQINMILLNGKSYPFGGICNKYYNIMHHLTIDPIKYDIAEKRQKLMFDREIVNGEKTIGITKSFFTNTIYPMYYKFFSSLGFRIVLPDEPEHEGMRMANSSFCFSVELSHGMFSNLVKKKPDYIFLPHITELHVTKSKAKGKDSQATCLLAQGEAYYLRSAFRNVKSKIISPVLNFSLGWNSMEEEFVKVGIEIGKGEEEARKAFREAVIAQNEFYEKKKELGRKVLTEIEKDKTNVGIVLFGRPYNSLPEYANLSIPRKFASRGVYLIPFECLNYEDEDSMENMSWAIGQDIIKAARLVKKHPQLFGCFITNFSCGPDSFLVGYFRDIMKTKPSLTLELDSHSADAGVNTRIEAFLDIVERFKKLGLKDKKEEKFNPARIEFVGKKIRYISSENKEYPLNDPKVKMIMPSMGRTTAEAAAAVFSGIGIRSEAVELPDFSVLMKGRSNTSCKECLPLILTTASLVDYLEKRSNPDELLIYFMPTASGGCRFAQYYVFLKNMINKKRIKNVALLTLSTENSYAGLNVVDQIKILEALIFADIMDDIKNALHVLAVDQKTAEVIFEREWNRILACLNNGGWGFYRTIEEVAHELSKIKLLTPIKDAKKVILSGEIYVRKDEFSSQDVIKRLAKRKIVVKRAPVLEWLYYVDYIVERIYKTPMRLREKMEFKLKKIIQTRIEKRIKKIMAKSNLYEYETIDMDEIMKIGSKFINPNLGGEAIIAVGCFFHEIAKHVHGFVSIGPFACMQTRIVEAILVAESKAAGNERIDFLERADKLKSFNTLPFLSLESDGNPFPQIVKARIEAFSLQVERVYRQMRN